MGTPVALPRMQSSYHFDNLILIRLQSSSRSGNLIRQELQIKLRKAYVYNGLMKLGDVGMSSAASFYQSIVGFILVMFSNWLVKKRNMEGSLF